MRYPLLAALALVMVLPACGTRLNPLNWFGSPEPVAVEPLPEGAKDERPLAQQVTGLKVDAMPGGIIVRATGVMATQGYWNAELVAQEDEPADGALVYEFRVAPPKTTAAVSTPRSRQITAAVFLSDIRLATISSITVRGATNGLTTRR